MVNTDKAKILIVDDTPANLSLLHRVLSKLDAEVISAESGNDALTLVLQHDFALFLLDVQMPEMNGYELADILLNDDKTQEIPIIFITAAYRDEIHQLEGYEHGAIDYIEKPINNKILLAKVKILLKLWQKNKQLNQILEDIAEKNFSLQTEIAERKKLEAKLEHLAMYDELTNLPNRALLKKGSHQHLSAAERFGHRVGYMFIDLDGFKAVNDNHSHETGDVVLIEMTFRMVSAVRDNDIVTRYGGDEFIIILPDCKSNAEIELIANRILQDIRNPITSVDIVEKLSASIGISIYPEDAHTSNELISLADKAMYKAKKSGKNQFRFWNSKT